ncbi:hypothetical protein OU994_08470 [Pseudoduganella sp. SL102]|uniref:hypothetical protein n=1 Tax=Pseudoduganella sp. SL102 TaxID=2995154 RepID=UPI00248B2582|nr:hypothetical protein [Pseudoduganella sp. SL102]WBS04297.1 hypothetical protein OU994_08470 [Pseudoduganella sp. SL102]
MATSAADIAAIPADLMQLVEALHRISPNRFHAMVNRAATAAEWYDAVLALRYAANARELRDTGDERVHGLCEEIRRHVARIDDVFQMTLLPASPVQQREWEGALAADGHARQVFRTDGSLHISLLDSDLRGAALHVRRAWNHVCNFTGSWTDFTIGLDEAQAADWQARRARLRAMQEAIEKRRQARSP